MSLSDKFSFPVAALPIPIIFIRLRHAGSFLFNMSHFPLGQDPAPSPAIHRSIGFDHTRFVTVKPILSSFSMSKWQRV